MPGGKIKPGEHIEDAALRELKEETGIDNIEIINGFLKSIEYSFDRANGHHEKKVDFLVFYDSFYLS